jgi:hypothetical protein
MAADSGKKSIFKWTSSFEDLELFCKKYLKIESYTTSHGERFHSLKAKPNITINLYKIGTLQLQGNLSQSMKLDLHSLLKTKNASEGLNLGVRTSQPFFENVYLEKLLSFYICGRCHFFMLFN